MTAAFRYGFLVLMAMVLAIMSPGGTRAAVPDDFEIDLPSLYDSGGRQATTYATGIQTIRRNFGRPFRGDIAELYGTRFTMMYLRQRGGGRLGILVDQSNLYAVAYYTQARNAQGQMVWTLYHAQDFDYERNRRLLPPDVQAAPHQRFDLTTHYQDLQRAARQRRDQIIYNANTLNSIYEDLYDLTDPNQNHQTVARAFLRIATAYMEAARFADTETGAIQYGIEQALRAGGNYVMDAGAMRLTNTWAAAAELVRLDTAGTNPYHYASQGDGEGQVSWTTIYRALQSLALMIAVNQINCGNARVARDAGGATGIGETYCFSPPRAETLIETHALPKLMTSVNTVTMNVLH